MVGGQNRAVGGLKKMVGAARKKVGAPKRMVGGIFGPGRHQARPHAPPRFRVGPIGGAIFKKLA